MTVAFFPANADGDDIIVYTDETRTKEAGPHGHASTAKWARTSERRRHVALADFVARGERPCRLYRRLPEPGIGEERSRNASRGETTIFEDPLASLADRLAEAFPERLTSASERSSGATAP